MNFASHGLGLVFVAWMAGALLAQDFQGATHLLPFEEENLQYGKTPASGAIARLQGCLDRGETALDWDDRRGYLPSLLHALGISTNSQVLVFSKTSFQRELISPRNPRALFFNDEVYVGFVPGSPVLEFSMADPKLGGVFYTLDNRRETPPRFVRTDACLECHASAKTMGVPGHLVRSFQTDERGAADLLTGTEILTHRTPLAERWGGWFVTGRHGDQTHRGNLMGAAAFERQRTEPNFAGNQPGLAAFREHFDAGAYLAPTSDIVALMVLEHQLHMHNFLTRLQYEATLQLKAYGHCNYLKSQVEAFLRYLLFTEETPLTAAIRGTPEFERDFAAGALRDPQGRSLRDLDLQTRLFKHPCSYLIHSESFAALPEALKTRIYGRLWEILTGKDPSPDWSRLTPADRAAVLDILRATQKDLPESWRVSRPSPPP
ncbi:MAG: hypothetical protein KIT22_13775, partial [Verrucomicrobiae bacterium]|nr:hypothetical protein [Verrucomicrobiae bacterium]